MESDREVWEHHKFRSQKPRSGHSSPASLQCQFHFSEYRNSLTVSRPGIASWSQIAFFWRNTTKCNNFVSNVVGESVFSLLNTGVVQDQHTRDREVSFALKVSRGPELAGRQWRLWPAPSSQATQEHDERNFRKCFGVPSTLNSFAVQAFPVVCPELAQELEFFFFSWDLCHPLRCWTRPTDLTKKPGRVVGQPPREPIEASTALCSPVLGAVVVPSVSDTYTYTYTCSFPHS